MFHLSQTMGGVFSGKEQDATRGIYAFAGRGHLTVYQIQHAFTQLLYTSLSFNTQSPTQVMFTYKGSFLDHVSLWVYLGAVHSSPYIHRPFVKCFCSMMGTIVFLFFYPSC